MNEKVLVKLKDKTSTLRIFEQGISLVGERPAYVEETPFVKKLLVNGCLVKAKEAELKAWDNRAENNKAAKSKAQKEKEDKDKKYVEFQAKVKEVETALDSGELETAATLLKEAEKLGGKNSVDQLKKVLQGKESRKAQEAEILNLANAAIEKGLIEKGENGYSIDGKIVAETESALVNYLINSKKVREAIQKQLA